MKIKKIKDLEKGDKVHNSDDELKTVREVSKGLYLSSKIVTFTDGTWACELNETTVEVY